MKLINLFLAAVLIGVLMGTAGCSGSGQEELQRWVKEQRNEIRPKVPPLQEPTKFSPQAYTHSNDLEPFSIQKLTQALKRASGQANTNATLIMPELNRRKEPLEASPLDTITMVGSLIKIGQPVALVRMDNLIYQARVGNHLGQNYGRITKVSETGLVLREIVQDASGEWIERMVSLQLLEQSK